MPWDASLQTSFQIPAVGVNEELLGTDQTASDVFGSPILHDPGEISDLIVVLTPSADPTGKPLRISAYNTVLEAPALRTSYGDEPIARVEYQPPGTSTVERRFPFPIGRFYKMQIGVSSPGGVVTYEVQLEWRQDNVNLSP